MSTLHPITQKFIGDINNWKKRVVEFLWEQFIINPKVFPLDSEFSYSSYITAKNIQSNLGKVLDIGTWSWVHAIIAAKKWATQVLAIDIDDNCLQNAQENVSFHNLNQIIEVRKSNLFDNINHGELFDTIISNIPFADDTYTSEVSHFLFDPWFVLHKKLLAQASAHLCHWGRVYIPSWTVANEDLLLDLVSAYRYRIVDIVSEHKWWIERKVYILGKPE